MSLPATVKALQVQDDQSIKLVDIPFASRSDVQNIGEDYILIRVRAIGLNPSDWKYIFFKLGQPGSIAGFDAAGDVVKVGARVTHLKVGDRAAGFTIGANISNDNGAFSEYVLLSASVAFRVAEEQTYAEAAAMPIAHLTAVQALYNRMNLALPSSPSKEKKPILIWGGSTAVGHHAVQLAALSGYEVFVTGSPAAHDYLKMLGASHVFDYKDPETPKKIQAAAGPDGITIALDTVSDNGTTDAVAASLSPLSPQNSIITILPETVAEELPSNTTANFMSVYTAAGIAFKFARQFDYPLSPEDRDKSLEYVKEELPIILKGWKTGQGSPSLKGQKLRILPGGLESVVEGLDIMQKGDYGREKLIYIIA